jgi:uncharacterized membrane protein YoaK (UPF0700 family)
VLSYPRRLRSLAVALAALAGFVDAIAFLQLGGFFVSFMSGNSTRLGVGLAQAPVAALIAGGLIVCFVLGVVTGSLVGRHAGRRQRPAVLGVVALILSLAGMAHLAGLVHPSALLLAVAMGAENATFERDGEARIGVTYMTGALVKLGQGLASAFTGGDRKAWLAYLFLWAGLVSGAFLGAMAYSAVAGQAVWCAAGVAALLSLLALIINPE